MKYGIEELVPIVAKLAENYTSKESTSITYDKAQQLMGAVVYCIKECEMSEQFHLASVKGISAQEAYDIGAVRVEQKVKETLKLYNEVAADFSGYGNECLYDTVMNGLPEFFKWYDCRFEPQNTILTLDYPVLFDVPQHTGIDKIYDFVTCIQLEQNFLNRFSSELVIGILSKYNERYKLMIDNLCEIVLMNVAIHVLSGKKLTDLSFELEEYRHLQTLIQKEDLNDLREMLRNAVKALVWEYYENDGDLENYLCKAVEDISVRVKNAADNENLQNLF